MKPEQNFEYNIGDALYYVYHDSGLIIRHKVTRICVEHRESGKRVIYYDGHLELQKASETSSWGVRPCSIFRTRKEANKAVAPYAEKHRLKEIEDIKKQQAYLNDKLAELEKKKV